MKIFIGFIGSTRNIPCIIDTNIRKPKMNIGLTNLRFNKSLVRLTVDIFLGKIKECVHRINMLGKTLLLIVSVTIQFEDVIFCWLQLYLSHTPEARRSFLCFHHDTKVAINREYFQIVCKLRGSWLKHRLYHDVIRFYHGIMPNHLVQLWWSQKLMQQ